MSYLQGIAMPSKYISIIGGLLFLYLDILGKKKPHLRVPVDDFLSTVNFLMNNEQAGNSQKRRRGLRQRRSRR